MLQFPLKISAYTWLCYIPFSSCSHSFFLLAQHVRGTFFYSIACFVANLNSTTHMHIRTKSHEKWDGKLHTHAYLICFSNGKTNSLSISYSTNSRRYGNFYYPTILYQIDQNPSGFERGASVRSFFLASKMFVSKTNVNVKISSTKNNDTMMKTLRNSLHVSDT